MKVLIADDDDIQLEILSELLGHDGDEVVLAHDGTEAIARYHGDHPQMVILDWEMPGLDGLEVCRQIRADHSMGYVYVVLLTARRDHQDVIDGLSAGADDFLTKPFEPGELKVRLNAGRRILSLETRHVAIFALAKLADSRDPETGLHLERMREFSRLLARHIAGLDRMQGILPPDFEEMVYLTSPLHDIGKVGIPDCVLLKPGRLTSNEFEVMKRHAMIGGDTLDAASGQYPEIEYLCMARDIALGHHERFDGTGYPQGISGENIPLAARIVALADVYDALTSKRVYKSAYTHDIAKQMILEGSGRHFDPLIVAAFEACEDEFIAIKEKYAEDPKAEHAYAVVSSTAGLPRP